MTRVSHALGVRHGQRSASTTLGVHQVATVPMPSIAWLSIALGITLYYSARYQINVGYAIAFGGFTILMTSAWSSFYTMRGLRLSAQPTPAPCHVGASMRFCVQVEDTTGKRRKNLILHAGSKQYELTIEPNSKVEIEFEAPALYRGTLAAPMIKIGTPYPMGIWNTHHLWMPLQTGLVYPKVEEGAPPLAGIEDDLGDGANARDLGENGDTLVTMRNYQSGDSPRRVAWRLFAKTDGRVMATKQSLMGGQRMEDLWVDEAALGHMSNPEHRLSRLCAWVHQAHALGVPFGFTAAGVTLEPGHGPDHLNRCMEALALANGHQRCVAFSEATT